MARYAMVIDPDRCVDCKACMVACTSENAVPVGQHRNWVDSTTGGTFPELRMRIEPEQCHHCDDPPCVQVCPTGASRVSETGGIVIIEKSDCIGCRYCMQACPYDARSYNEELGVVDKCTFCSHRILTGRDPACVETCPTNTRVFGDIDDPDSEAARLLRTRTTMRKKEEAGSGPNLYYLVD